VSRKIIHVDMDAFYASVEVLDNPELRGKPVIVGGSAEGRGVVSAASYEAREYGVHSAMPTAQAKRLCPKGVFLPVRGKRYAEISRRIRGIFHSYTPLVEPLSLDEAYLDVTGSEKLFGPADEIGRKIKDGIREETGLTASVGVAPNKFLAKVASDLRKPDGFVVVREGEEREFLAALPVERLWGVGKRTAEELRRRGIRRVEHLQDLGRDRMAEIFGGSGEHLFDLACGVDNSPVVADSEPKSISHETTFGRDVTDPDVIRRTLLELSEAVGTRMRKQGFYGRTVHLKVRLPPFRTLTRDQTLPFPSQTDGQIYGTALRLYGKANAAREPVRLLGVGMTGLVRSLAGAQLLIFESDEERRGNLDRAIDRVREKFGTGVMRRGRSMMGEEKSPPS